MSFISNIKEYLSGLFTTPATTQGPVASPAPLHEDDGISFNLVLPDGRNLGYAEYGSRTGQPIILNHGFGCSRFDGAYFHEIGQQVGARIICVDRPGMGWSSPQPNRTVLDYTKDVEHLTEHLKLDKYSVMV
jgi:pimeloyl-ACP methyl ester carboxylesterase